VPTDSLSDRRLRVLFFAEGYTDIRFVVGLSEICELTLAVPTLAFEGSGLDRRVAESGAKLTVHKIPGGRLGFQVRSLGYLLRSLRGFDVVLAQEVTRGALNANVAGRLLGVPVLNTLMVAPVEYFRCRWERGLIPWWKYRLGDAVIRWLMRTNGRLATGWLALGPYLSEVARRCCPSVRNTHYYGVDVRYFRPTDSCDRRAARTDLGLPAAGLLVLLASRISHEKDPETALRAVARIRSQGVDAVAVNLGGGYRDFVALARRLKLPDAEAWVIGRPAAHPMRELARYYQAADVLVQASLAEGLGLSPLEALACGVPVVATAVGGMASTLPGYARLFPRGDDKAAAEHLAWVATHPEEARAQALQGREFVAREWSRDRAFADLDASLRCVSSRKGKRPRPQTLPS
jgi:glycosyltransferase involved in cell wall biosynthesis